MRLPVKTVWRDRLRSHMDAFRRNPYSTQPFRLPVTTNQQGMRDGIAIASLVKNERPYIEEWIEFHTLRGIRAFFIYDNGSNDGTPEFLRNNQWESEVHCFDWRSFDGLGSAQRFAFCHAIANYGADFRWMLFLDLDEFVFPVEDVSLIAALSRCAHLPSISMPWMNFGPDSHQQPPPGLVIENYTERATFPADDDQRHLFAYKTFVDPLAVSVPGVHYSQLRDYGDVMFNERGQSVPRSRCRQKSFACNEILRLHHYFTRSFEEMARKRKRGPGSFGINNAIAGQERFSSYGDKRFEQYMLSRERDRTMLKFVPELKERIETRRKQARAQG